MSDKGLKSCSQKQFLPSMQSTEIMEESGKAPESDCTGDVTGELRALLAILDDDCGDDFSPMNRIKEELVEEVMQELWKEISCCYGGMNSPLPPSSFPASSSSVGGDYKTCGPSFSDSSRTGTG
ncbi:hypothetical protein F0562_011976 [Nyssa sinensis]|uniref:Uncharacterized protein n=1 Tax=Nyssa sinensis TaxID=561372 RepID=A0A5J4ZUD0_9ASTE|nr:hypothetical protein F0562_011976 [Nyssa sinensis]